MLKYFLAWFPMVLIAVINGTIRQFVYLKYVGELRAHQISTVTAILFMGAYIWGVTSRWKPLSLSHAIAIGLMWFGMTIAFEFLFGHFVGKHPWRELLTDYNLREGRIWILVPLWVAFAPYFFYRLKTD